MRGLAKQALIATAQLVLLHLAHGVGGKKRSMQVDQERRYAQPASPVVTSIRDEEKRTGMNILGTEHQFREIDSNLQRKGKHIVFTSNRSDDPDFSPDTIGLYVIPAEGGEVREIPTPIGRKSNPSVSPDGQWVAYTGLRMAKEWWQNTHLWVVPIDGSSSPRDLTADHDFTVAQDTTNDIGGAVMTSPTWSTDSKALYFQVSQPGRCSRCQRHQLPP